VSLRSVGDPRHGPILHPKKFKRVRSSRGALESNFWPT
jgi:hypothetical protein